MSQQQDNIRKSIIKGLKHIPGSEVAFKEQIDKIVEVAENPDSTQLITASLELFNKIAERTGSAAFVNIDTVRQVMIQSLPTEISREISSAIIGAADIRIRYNKINQELRKSEDAPDHTKTETPLHEFKVYKSEHVEDKVHKEKESATIADLCAQMYLVEALNSQAPEYAAATANLEETSKSFFENLKSPKQWEAMEASFNKEFPKAGKVVSDMLVQEKENIISFKMDGALAKYLQSADPKTLAKNLDRNMRDNHITLDKDFTKNEKVQKFFPKEVLEKITALGKELDNLREERSTFVGKVKQTIKNYAGMIMDAFSKLTEKKVDDPLLGDAIKEYAKKTQMIDAHLEKNVDKTQTKQAENVGKFVGQLLATQPRSITRNI